MKKGFTLAEVLIAIAIIGTIAAIIIAGALPKIQNKIIVKTNFLFV